VYTVLKELSTEGVLYLGVLPVRASLQGGLDSELLLVALGEPGAVLLLPPLILVLLSLYLRMRTVNPCQFINQTIGKKLVLGKGDP
jgi:hypothetical protein